MLIHAFVCTLTLPVCEAISKCHVTVQHGKLGRYTRTHARMDAGENPFTAQHHQMRHLGSIASSRWRSLGRDLHSISGSSAREESFRGRTCAAQHVLMFASGADQAVRSTGAYSAATRDREHVRRDMSASLFP